MPTDSGGRDRLSQPNGSVTHPLHQVIKPSVICHPVTRLREESAPKRDEVRRTEPLPEQKKRQETAVRTHLMRLIQLPSLYCRSEAKRHNLDAVAKETPTPAAVNMRKFRTFGFLLTLAMMIPFVYWVGTGLINFDFLAAASLGPRVRLPSPVKDPPPTFGRFSLVSDIDVPGDQLPEPGNGEAADPSYADPGNQAAKTEERHIPRQEENVHQTGLAPKLLQRQVGFSNVSLFVFFITFRRS